MAVRHSVDLVTQVGGEVTPGTVAAANRLLAAMTMRMKQKRGNKTFRAQGFNVPSAQANHKKWSEGSYEGPGDFSSIVYPLSTRCPAVTPVKQGALNAWQWDFLPPALGSMAGIKTFTFEAGDASAVNKDPAGRYHSLKQALNPEDGKDLWELH